MYSLGVYIPIIMINLPFPFTLRVRDEFSLASLPFSLLFFFFVVVLVKLAQLKCEEQEDESCSRPGVFL